MSRRALLALLLLWVGGSHASRGGPWRMLQQQAQQPSYSNLLTAAQREVRVINQLYYGVFREKGWANTPDFKPLLGVAVNPKANITAFFPADESWKRVADYYCLTQQAVLDNIANLPSMLAGYIKSHLVPDQTLFSRDFRDGLVLETMRERDGVVATHTLSERHTSNGTVVWVFKNASIFYDPKTQSYEDVVVNSSRMDITAGNGVIHVVNTMFRDSDTERFWNGLRSQVLARAGMPPDSRECPSESAPPSAMTPSQIAGIVIGIVLGLLLLGVGIMILLSRHPSRSGSFKRFDSLKMLSWQQRRNAAAGGGASSAAAAAAGGPSAGPGLASSAATLPLLLPAGAASARWGGHLASSTGGGSGSLSSSSLGGCSTGQPQAGAQHGDAGGPEHMSAVAEESPFMLPRGSSHPHLVALAAAGGAAAAAGGAAAMLSRQGTGSASDTASSSFGGTHKVADSYGSGTPSASGAGSNRDHLGPLPTPDGAAVGTAAAAVAAGAFGVVALHHGAHGGPGWSEADGAGGAGADQQFCSLDSTLAATDSVPVGRINQEHVIPLSELQLRELIGSGAEGKVYRGTWKHTDIAAKEYLPIEPPHAMGHPAARADAAPSEAAMASARAALAKEVHWLTSLNHPNLVRFCAVCLERPLVVMEFYKHGSVFAMLQKASRQLTALQMKQAADLSPRRRRYIAYFNWDRRLEMLHDVAAGMSYLHGKDHIHGDLRSPNLFVGADGKVKIGDFGFTKRLSNRASLKVKRITHPRWVAPELMMDNILSRASDVYSFGIIMYELLTFQIPFDPLGKEQVVISVMQGCRPGIPSEEELPPGTSSSTCLATYVRLMKECWAQDPAERPSFEVIARRLKAMQRWRMLISRHVTLQRAISAMRRSRSSSSLSNSQLSKLAAAAAAGGPPPIDTTPPRHARSGMRVSSSMGDFSTSTVATSAASPARNRSGTASRGTTAATDSSAYAPLGSSVAAGSSQGGFSWQQQQYPRPQLSPLAVGHHYRAGSRDGFGGYAGAAAPAVPDFGSEDPEDEYEYDELPGYDDLEDGDGGPLGGGGGAGGAATAANSSLAAVGSFPVSEAIVRGTRLAIIGVSNPQEERDALASTCAELAAAKQVLLVTSDLPTGRPFSRAAQQQQQQQQGGLKGGGEGGGALRRASFGAARHPVSASNSFSGRSQLEVQVAKRASSDLTAVQQQQLQLAHQEQQQQQQEQHQQQHYNHMALHPLAAATATVTAAASALAAAAAGAARKSGLLGGAQHPQHQHAHHAAQPPPQQQQQPLHVQLQQLPPLAAAGSGGSYGSDQPRRHSEPLPGKSRLSQEVQPDPSAAAAAAASGADKDTMSSGQSPFAVVRVAPPGIEPSRELQLVHHHQPAGVQQVSRAGSGIVESHPLFGNLTSELNSPSAPLSPKTAAATAAAAAAAAGSGAVGAVALAHAAGSGANTARQQHEQQQQGQQGKQPQQDQHGPVRAVTSSPGQLEHQQHPHQQHQQQPEHQQALLLRPSVQHLADLRDAHEQQLPHQQQGPPGSQQQQLQLQPAGGAAATAAAAAASPPPPPGVLLDPEEVYTTFDSPFYLGGWCAPSASMSFTGSVPRSAASGSASERRSGAAAAGSPAGAAAAAAAGSPPAGDQSSFTSPLLEGPSAPGPAGAPFNAAAAAAAIIAAVGQEDSVGLSRGGSPDSSLHPAQGGTSPQQQQQQQLAGPPGGPQGLLGAASQPGPPRSLLNEALTIEYQADMTPLAAAAAAAVSLHPASRRGSGAVSLPCASQPGSFSWRGGAGAQGAASPPPPAPAGSGGARASEQPADARSGSGGRCNGTSSNGDGGSAQHPALSVLCTTGSMDDRDAGSSTAAAASDATMKLSPAASGPAGAAGKRAAGQPRSAGSSSAGSSSRGPLATDQQQQQQQGKQHPAWEDRDVAPPAQEAAAKVGKRAAFVRVLKRSLHVLSD